MGASLQWRGEQPREPAAYGKTISFGNLRDRATGYMSYSERVGPGLVVLGGSTELCDRLTQEGFTALAPELPPDEPTSDRIVDAAIDHLLDNWHPRVGIMAFAALCATAERAARRKSLDALVLLEGATDLDEELVDDLRYDLS